MPQQRKRPPVQMFHHQVHMVSGSNSETVNPTEEAHTAVTVYAATLERLLLHLETMPESSAYSLYSPDRLPLRLSKPPGGLPRPFSGLSLASSPGSPFMGLAEHLTFRFALGAS